MKIGDNLRKIRNKRNYSQKDVADLLNVELNTYANWENNVNSVKSDKLVELSKIFDVGIEKFFEESTRGIEIKQEYKDNNNSLNGLIFVVTDKESFKDIADILKDKLKNSDKE